MFCKILKESGLQFDHQTLKGSFAKFLERVLECRLILENDKGFYDKLHTISNVSRLCTIKQIFSVADVDGLSSQNRDAVSVIKDWLAPFPPSFLFFIYSSCLFVLHVISKDK